MVYQIVLFFLMNDFSLINDAILITKGWELAFEDFIKKIRLNELRIVRNCNIFMSLISFNFNLVTYLLTVVSLATFVLSNPKNVLDPSIAYVSLSLFNAIRHPLYLFGLAISSLIQVNINLLL